MQLFGTGYMITFTEVAPGIEDDFNEWYNREHLDERIDLPGFRRARRFEAIDAEIGYMSTYECLRPEDIGSPAYLDVVRDQTEWSARIMPAFTKWHRMVGRAVATGGRGSGAFAALLRFRPDPARADELEAWLAGGLLDEIAVTPRLTGATAIAVVPEIDDRMTRAFGQEPDPDQIPEWGVLAEGTDIDAVAAAAHAALDETLAGFAVDGKPVFETWRFMYLNQRLSDDEKA